MMKCLCVRGHEMFHDDMIMYANINDQQPVIAMITRIHKFGHGDDLLIIVLIGC